MRIFDWLSIASWALSTDGWLLPLHHRLQDHHRRHHHPPGQFKVGLLGRRVMVVAPAVPFDQEPPSSLTASASDVVDETTLMITRPSSPPPSPPLPLQQSQEEEEEEEEDVGSGIDMVTSEEEWGQGDDGDGGDGDGGKKRMMSLEDELLEDPSRLEVLVVQEEGLPVDRSVARVPGAGQAAAKGEVLEVEEEDPLDDEEGKLIRGKIVKMLQRKIDLWAPEELFEMMPALLRGDRVERALRRRIGGAVGVLRDGDGGVTMKERKRLQHSLDFVQSLKHAEQSRLSRQWVQGLLESMGEGSEAMDEAVMHLVSLEQGCLVKPVLDTLDDMLRQLQEMSPDEKTLTQHVMEAIRGRVEAEVKTVGQPYTRLLAACLRLKTAEERERLLRLELKNSRVIQEFAEFVEEGAEYTARARVGPFKLADDTPEQMKAILAIVQGFTRGVAPSPSPSSPLPWVVGPENGPTQRE